MNIIARILTPLTIMSLAVLLLLNGTAMAQQVPDTGYHYENKAPAFEKGTGPKLVLDAAHSGFVRRGSFDPFLSLISQDGFQAGYLDSDIDAGELAKSQILMIVNAYRRDYSDFSVMEPPSAYKDSEIAAIVEWVKQGGRLLLIADHAPFAGGTAKLAEAFGFTFFNGYVLEEDSLPFRNGDIRYHTSGGLNAKHPIVSGNYVSDKFERFMIFAGSAFGAPPEAKPLLTIPKGYSALIMNRNRQNLDGVPKIDASGFFQGATLELGKGRIGVFAEAASFSAQIIKGVEKHGMNNSGADQNPLFVLATLRWLAEGL